MTPHDDIVPIFAAYVRDGVEIRDEDGGRQWWVTASTDTDPVGPVSTELMIQGICAGVVPKHALVCEAGEACWRWMGEIPEFLAALELRQRGAKA